MRVVIADPPGLHAVVRPRARGGARRAPGPRSSCAPRISASPSCRRRSGYERVERFYPLSSRLFRRSRARLPLKAGEHLGVAASLARLQDGRAARAVARAFPQIDVGVPFRSPSVFTAHDLLPRRTADKRELWRRLLSRFDRVVVHTERGREALRELGRRAAW